MDRRLLMTWALAGAGAVALAAGGAEAQGRDLGSDKVPPGHLPPPGQCRVWYDDRPPGRQLPPTSCSAAQREAYRTGGRVIYGGERRDDRYDRDGRYDRDDRYGRDDGDGKWERDDKWERDCDARERARGECGWGDRGRDDVCRDSDRDGWCDYAEGRYPDRTYPRDRRYPATLPNMVWGVVFGRGDRLAQRAVRQWVGTADVRARYVDANRNGRPEVVSWVNDRGVVVQRWIDDNRDGRADRVSVYERGRVVRVIR